MEPTSERARQGYAERRRQLELDDDALDRILASVEASVAAGEAESVAAQVGVPSSAPASLPVSTRRRVGPASVALLAVAAAGACVFWWGYGEGAVIRNPGADRAPASAAAFVRSRAFGGLERARTRSAAASSGRLVDAPRLPRPSESAVDPDPSAEVRKQKAPRPSQAIQPEPREGPDRSSDLKAEIALVRRARAALRAGDEPAARAALVQHRRAFPNGQLATDRESLWKEVEAIKQK